MQVNGVTSHLQAADDLRPRAATAGAGLRSTPHALHRPSLAIAAGEGETFAENLPPFLMEYAYD